MKKEIEKYVWYYLSVYIVVLLIFAAFQYFGVCDGQSLNCKTKWEKVKDILQTTAYIVTPIVAIIGFLSWKEPKKYELEKQYSESVLQYLNLINKELSSSYYRMCIDDLLSTKIIVLNSLNEKPRLEVLDHLYKASAEIKTLTLIKNDTSFDLNFKELETQIILLNGAIEERERMYLKNYYRDLPEEYKNSNKDLYKCRDIENPLSNAGIYSFTKNLKESIKIQIQEYHKGDFITYNYTYDKYKDNYDKAYEIFINILIDLIKLK